MPEQTVPWSVKRGFAIALAVAALAFGPIAARGVGAEPFYMGTWKVASAIVAPWWDDPVHKPDPSEVQMLIGKTVIFEAKRIGGPRPLMCNELKYRVRNYPADFLFQGQFGEMHLRDKAVDPVKVAASVGFSKGTLWKTVETGCANELDYHFIDDTTAAIGLNNYIYILKKQ
ncbi:MAG: hypothetical protein ABSB15_21585 [Bryobacteraceae bacterium]|jgi:hypothetical protein